MVQYCESMWVYQFWQSHMSKLQKCEFFEKSPRWSIQQVLQADNLQKEMFCCVSRYNHMKIGPHTYPYKINFWVKKCRKPEILEFVDFFCKNFPDCLHIQKLQKNSFLAQESYYRKFRKIPLAGVEPRLEGKRIFFRFWQSHISEITRENLTKLNQLVVLLDTQTW